MTLLQHYQFSLILTTIVTVAFGLWLFFIRKRVNKVAQLFSIYSFWVAAWSWCQVSASFSGDPAIALARMRTMFFAVTVFPVLLTHFFSAFLGVDQRKVSLAGWLLVAGFLPFILSEKFLLPGSPLAFLPSMPRGGPFFLPYNLVWLGWIVYDFWLLSRGAQGRMQPTKLQVRFLLAVFIFGYTVACTNWLYLYGIYIPPLQPFATYGVPIAFLAIAYGVFAYSLFDIHVVIRKSLVYSILVTLLTIGYFGAIYLIEQIFQAKLGYRSPAISVTAFALMALAFQPLKIGIQIVIDRLFFRARREDLARKVERLEQETRGVDKLKAVATLAAGLCHELRNPLQAIQTHAEFLPQRYDDPVFRKRCSEVMKTEIERVNDLLKQLMDFARPKSPVFRPVDPHRILDSTLDFLSNEFVKRQISLEKRYEANSVQIQADQDQVRQVVLNLVLNALQAIDKNGQVTVTTRQDNGWFTLEVSDTGPGIDPHILPKIFEPFVTAKEGGTGLGLSIVHSIIQEHRGEISIQSQPGHGATFTIKLPLV